MTAPKLPELCSPHSDMTLESLRYLEESFILAHRSAPGGLSIEVGTRRGGSALLALLALEQLYPDAAGRPMLFTVDPYGGKPYRGGDVVVPDLYGGAEYLAMKRLLSGFENHAHWYMESADFLHNHARWGYWYRSTFRRIEAVTFALLDGDHDYGTISNEVLMLIDLMAPGGVILIDNADRDPKTIRETIRALAEVSVRRQIETVKSRNAGEGMARIIVR